ncbi:hypothetical protein [Zoogloea sp. 1C4]|uniref:hypothetical protein n=1 Tax=Zoogloea sp. 1C4 TaxID=2570190 RepID=UPI0012924A7D|nr:hypothetical protein [Zoogloea sp. 1C4]
MALFLLWKIIRQIAVRFICRSYSHPVSSHCPTPAVGAYSLQAFGLHKATTEAYNALTKKRRTIKGVEPTPMRRIQEAFLTGAYSTGLADMPLIDLENPRASLDVEDYLCHVAGYALVEFAHPDDTRFPVFAVSRGGRGLIFLLQGTAYATAAEIR